VTIHAYECAYELCRNHGIELRREPIEDRKCDECRITMRDLGGGPFDSERRPEKQVRPALAKIREGFEDLGFECRGLDEYGLGVLGFKIPLTQGLFRILSHNDLLAGPVVDVLIRRGTTAVEDGNAIHFTKRLDDD